MSDTPISDSTPHNVADLGMLCRKLERDVNDGIDRIKRLLAERDTARQQADQKVDLRKEFRHLLGTDDVQEGITVVRGLQDRIKMLEEAGDALLRDNNDMANINQWRKAKEAKP